MKISFIPRYDRNAASSRIRVYALAEEIARQGLAEVTVHAAYPSIDALPIGDLAVIQKCPLPQWRAGEVPVVYDYDDDLPELIGAAANISKAFTVDTRARLDAVFPININLKGPLTGAENRAALAWIDKYKRGHVLPDCIDYSPAEPLPASPQMIGPCWFGNYGNYNCQWMADAVKQISPTAPIGIISDREWPIAGSTAIWQRWSYESFPAALRSFGVAMLSHKGQDQAKSNNKLIAAITLGVPCIVGQGSPSYEELLEECGLSRFVVRTAADVRDSLRELSAVEGRQAYLDKIQDLVWHRYHVSAIAKQAMEIYKGVL